MRNWDIHLGFTIQSHDNPAQCPSNNGKKTSKVRPLLDVEGYYQPTAQSLPSAGADVVSVVPCV
jgi:hypothetical protein